MYQSFHGIPSGKPRSHRGFFLHAVLVVGSGSYGECMASVLCGYDLNLVHCMSMFLFKNPYDTSCWVTHALEAVM